MSRMDEGLTDLECSYQDSMQKPSAATKASTAVGIEARVRTSESLECLVQRIMRTSWSRARHIDAWTLYRRKTSLVLDILSSVLPSWAMRNGTTMMNKQSTGIARMLSSKSKVKSKPPRHPWAQGPKESSTDTEHERACLRMAIRDLLDQTRDRKQGR